MLCLSLLNQSMILLPGYNGFICLVASDFPPLNFKDFPLFFSVKYQTESMDKNILEL